MPLLDLLLRDSSDIMYAFYLSEKANVLVAALFM